MSELYLSPNHWTIPYYRQRMTAKQWRDVLLDGNDEIYYMGNLTKLQAKSIGYGVVEVSKQLQHSKDKK